jgi:hypothetical protein
MDKIVLDIETSNTFADVGGERNIKDLNVSLVGLYSYNRDEYIAFHEKDIRRSAELFQKAGLIIGFAINRFDIPVLEKHFSFNLRAIPQLDLLEEVELATGKRISLNILAKTNLNLQKTHESGLEAIKLYKEKRFGELESYCLNDVKLTKELYELAKRQGHLLFPDRVSGEIIKARMQWQEMTLPATLF